MAFQNNSTFAKETDAINPLAPFRKLFHIPTHHDKEAIYFLGNSLGLQPKNTEESIKEILDQWRILGVESFFKGEKPWLHMHRELQPLVSKIVGALPHEIVIMNSLTVNLHLMMVSFYRPEGKRTKIICEAKAFPSDQYTLHSHVKQRGLNPEEIIIEVAPREGEVLIREEDIQAAIESNKDELALLFWGGVNYYSGQVFNMEALSRWAHTAGALVGLDLAHAAGNIPLQLHHWNIDFACWCSYKYLNSGPGGIGGVYIHEKYHNDPTLERYAGWWGHEKKTQFLMQKEFVPEPSAEGWQLSTPSPILYAAHKTALDMFEEAGVETVLANNQKLNQYLWFVLEKIKGELPAGSFKIFTPDDVDAKGCQVSLQVKEGKKVFDQLSAEGVFADWREPDVIRIAAVSLYNTYEEVWQFGQHLKNAILSFVP